MEATNNSINQTAILSPEAQTQPAGIHAVCLFQRHLIDKRGRARRRNTGSRGALCEVEEYGTKRLYWW